MRKELIRWKAFLLRSMPGNIGVRLRKAILIKGFAACGYNPYILKGFMVDNPYRLFIGNNFRCNRDCYINAGGTVRIRDNVLLGPNVKIWSVNHKTDDFTIPIYQQDYSYSEVVIGDNVWIAANVFISPGVIIGERSVIGAGTVLTKSIPPYSKVMGNPGKITKSLLTV